MRIKSWFQKFHNRPLKIAAALFLAVWFVFAERSYTNISDKQEAAVRQTADLLSLSIESKDRALAETLLESLATLSGADSAAVCQGSEQILSARQSFTGCSGDKAPWLVRVLEKKIPGSEWCLRRDLISFKASRRF